MRIEYKNYTPYKASKKGKYLQFCSPYGSYWFNKKKFYSKPILQENLSLRFVIDRKKIRFAWIRKNKYYYEDDVYHNYMYTRHSDRTLWEESLKKTYTQSLINKHIILIDDIPYILNSFNPEEVYDN